MKPHKHKELIIAWANGATIQYQHRGDWMDIDRPSFEFTTQYRVKPEIEVPTTSLSAEELKVAYNTAEYLGEVPYFRLRCVANAAIRQYILDEEAKAKS